MVALSLVRHRLPRFLGFLLARRGVVRGRYAPYRAVLNSYHCSVE